MAVLHRQTCLKRARTRVYGKQYLAKMLTCLAKMLTYLAKMLTYLAKILTYRCGAVGVPLRNVY